MKRSFAAVAAAAMLAASVPAVGFASDGESSSSSSSSTSSISSVSSASSSSVSSSSSSVSSEKGNGWKAPCDDLKGLIKAQCIAKIRIQKEHPKERMERRNDSKVLQLHSDCKDKVGQEKVSCFKDHGNKGIKHEIRKAVRQTLIRTVRGKAVEESSSASSESSEM